MQVLWARGRATVSQVLEELPSPSPAYNTVLTLLRILEQKGHVRHEKDGRAFTYMPLVDYGQARRRAVSQLLKRFFDGSAELLMLDLLGGDRANPDEVRRVRELIAKGSAGAARRAKGESAR